MANEKYYFEKIAKRGSTLYYSLLGVNSEQRKAIIALHALYHELLQATENVHDVQVAQAKIAWWNQEIKHMFNQQAQHPITQFLQTFITPYRLPYALFEELIQGAQFKLVSNTVPSEKEFNLYCYQWGGTRALLSSFITGQTQPETTAFAHDIGMAMQIVQLILNFRTQVIHDKVLFAENDLKKYHINRSQLSELKLSNNIRHFLKFQANKARKYYLNSLNLLPKKDRNTQRHLLVLGKIFMVQLDELEKENFELFNYLVDLTPIRKFWIGIRTR